jgi:GTP cyclohydrolase I
MTDWKRSSRSTAENTLNHSDKTNAMSANCDSGEIKQSLAVESKVDRLRESFSNIIKSIEEEDVSRESIKKTPERAAEAFMYFTKGYNEQISGNLGVRGTGVLE